MFFALGKRQSPITVADGGKTLSVRLDDVEDRLSRIERRYLKLQGELTGAIRYQRQLEEELEDARARDLSDDFPDTTEEGE
jgi:DNA repair ATPase RecN